MPLYEDLARRAGQAGHRSAGLHRDSQRLRDLAQILRDAAAGRVSIRRCAWCDRFRIGSEWLHLDAIGSGQQHIRASLMERASHGICETCKEEELRRSEAGRAYLDRNKRE